MPEQKPVNSAPVFTIISFVLSGISLIPLLGIFSIPALILAVMGIAKKEGRMAGFALFGAIVGFYTSPTAWLILCLIPGLCPAPKAEPVKPLASICGKPAGVKTTFTVNGNRSCTLNGVSVDCLNYDSYESGDTVQCSTDKTRLLPSRKTPDTKEEISL